MGKIKSLDPGVVQDRASALITSNIYENLVRFDRGSKTIKPQLAVSWESSSNKRVWTFHLRKNVKFHDGTSFDAWAVKFNFDRQSDPRHPYHYPNYGRFLFFESLFGTYQEMVEKIEVVDLYTVRITLNKPCAPFLKELAHYSFGIISPAAVKKWEDEYYKNPVGTGPFKFLDWKMPNRVVLVANRDYWGKKPYLERIIFEPFEEPISCQRQLERGQIDVMTDVMVSSIEELKKRADLRVVQVPVLNFCYLAINCQRFPFNQKTFRIALNHLINKREIVESYYENRALAAVSPIPPRMEGYSTLKGYNFDKDRAVTYLKKSRLPRDPSFVLLYPDIMQPYLNNPSEVANRISAQLKTGKIEVIPRQVEYGEFMRMVRYGEYDLALWGTVDETGDPDAFMVIPWDTGNARSGGTNVCYYINNSVHSLLWKARGISEGDPKRAVEYRKIQEYLHEDAPMVPLVYSSQVIAYYIKVQNFPVQDAGLYNLSNVWLGK